MPRLPIARRRLAGAAVTLAVLLALPWPRGAGLDALLGRLLAAWHGVTSAVEEPPPADEETEPAPPPSVDPKNEGDIGPSVDPNGNQVGESISPSSAPAP